MRVFALKKLVSFFARSDRYSVTRPSRETIYGSAREFNWQCRVWKAALEQYERRDAALHNLVLPIDRRVLLQFLMEAVEEVQATSVLSILLYSYLPIGYPIFHRRQRLLLQAR